ncbi:6845_t:CDS:2 [Gigaspora rosea]|nr:6845_t:CDS:2 [Gigaspora rosea]
MAATPDASFKYIIHIRDHFTQFSYAEASQTKSAQDAAICLFNFCLKYGPPAIHHSDNGNDILQVKLGLWMEETRTINNQYCSAHKTTPYSLVFKKYPYCDMNLVDILENDQQNEEADSSFDDLSETDSDMTFVTANSDSGNYNNNDNYLDSSISQLYSTTPQEIIEVSDSDSSQASVDTVISRHYTAQEKEKWRASSIDGVEVI